MVSKIQIERLQLEEVQFVLAYLVVHDANCIAHPLKIGQMHKYEKINKQTNTVKEDLLTGQ